MSSRLLRALAAAQKARDSEDRVYVDRDGEPLPSYEETTEGIPAELENELIAET